MLSLLREVCIAGRMLRRAPAVTVPAILVLALGLSSATALYAIVYALWLKPLPYPEAHRLVSVTTYFPAYKMDALVSPDYGTWQGTRSLGALAAYSTSTAVLSGVEEAVEVSRARVSASLLPVLGIQPALGRTPDWSDDPKAPQAALLADGLWRDRFGADRAVIGRVIQIDGVPHTVAGVLPRGFRMPSDRRIDLLTPLAIDSASLRHGLGGGMKILRGVARLQPGITIEQARTDLTAKLAVSRAQEPNLYQNDVSLRVAPLKDYVAGDSRAAALTLLGAIVSILLIACANVASLLVARAAGRAREMAVRRALGASRLQIARHLLIEGLMISTVGIIIGLTLAQGLLAGLERLGGAMLAQVQDLALNRDVLIFAVAATAGCTLAFSLAPALSLSRIRTRRVLVAGQLGLSLTLLFAAGLMLRTLEHLRAIHPGFRTEQLLTASMSLKGTRFSGQWETVAHELRDRLRRTPGVLSIAFADALPPADSGRVTTFSRADRPMPEPFQRGDNIVIRLVDAEYFPALGISIRQGRLFTEDDIAHGSVAIVSQALAERYFAGENPLGKQVNGIDPPWATIVGVVADARNDGLRNPIRPEIYLPFTNSRRARGGGVTSDLGINLAVRTAGDQEAMTATLRGHVRELDPRLVARIRTMDEQWAGLTKEPRFHATALAVFATLAVLLAGTGLYGLLSHVVVLRRREIGIRIALGAEPRRVRGLIYREALLLAAAGVVLGSAASCAGARLLAGLLYGIQPNDPVTLAAVTAILAALSLLASALPAFRASRQNPADTLRAE